MKADTRATTPKPSKKESRRLALMLSAERYVAENGIAGASLRRIQRAAGHRNASATHYHFGSREGILQAVFRYRTAGINTRRLALIERFKKEGRLRDLRSLCEAFIRPIADELAPRPEGNFSVRFVEQISRERMALERMATEDLTEGWRIINHRVRELLSYLPKPAVDMRLDLSSVHSISALASVEARLTIDPSSRDILAFIVEALIDSVAAILVSPVSTDSLDAIKALGRSELGLPLFATYDPRVII
jgi:AcrR family transcriptional regulator